MPAVSPEIIHIVDPPVEIVYGGIALGNVDMRFGDPVSVYENRARLLQALKPSKYILQKVLLKPEFIDLSDVPDMELAEVYPTDGVIINRPGIALGLHPADCNAVAMYDGKQGSVLGMIHIGRQGFEGGIHINALEQLTNVHGVPKKDIRMHFAPSIRQDSYAYPHETLPAEQLNDPRWQGFIELRRGNYHVDLVGCVVGELVRNGIEPDQMTISPIDVGADPNYFSHVRSKQTGEPVGRNGVAAMLQYSAPAFAESNPT